MTLNAEALSTRAITTGDIEGKARQRRDRQRKPVITGILLGILCVLWLTPFIWMTLSVTKPTDIAFANPPVMLGLRAHAEGVRRPVGDDVLLGVPRQHAGGRGRSRRSSR